METRELAERLVRIAKMLIAAEGEIDPEKMKELDSLAMEQYGKKYSDLPDDGPEQDHLMNVVGR